MRILFALLLLCGPWLSAIAAPAVTVQGAIKLLSRDQAKNLVRIEAREGSPAPDRWYIQVYDPSSENGLRELVVFQKAVVASRTISQFLDGAKAGDVVGAKLVKIDSDDLIKITQQYVEANNLDVAKINYTMLKDADNPAPVWKLSCLDDSGKKLAEIVINARNANVVSHDGFDLAPGQAAKPAAAVSSPAPAAAPAPSASPQPGGPVVKPAVAVLPATAVKPSPSPIAAATPKPKPSGGLFQRMFGGKKPTPTPAPTPAPTPKIP